MMDYDILIFCLVIIGIYSVLFFFDSFFKSCMHYPYDAFLRGTGLTVKLFRIQWYTTALNRSIVKWASKYPKLLKYSFDLGVYASLFMLPLVYILWAFGKQSPTGGGGVGGGGADSGIIQGNGDDQSSIGIEIMMPGLNLPLNEIGYYVSALAICSIVHEMGHAFAAVLEDVAVTGFGFYILLIFPIAYTNINADHVNGLRLWNRLKILTAGIWHNIALGLIGYLIFSMLGVLFLPLYTTNSAVIVTFINKKSLLLVSSTAAAAAATEDGNNLEGRSLHVHDVISSINNCPVYNLDTWYSCLLKSIKEPPAYCITSDFVLNHDESVPIYHSNDGGSPGGEGIIECCDQANLKNLCFEYLTDDSENSILEHLPQYMCFNARKTIEQSRGYCQHNFKLCQQYGRYCVKPLLNNSTTVIQLRRHSSSHSMSTTTTAETIASPQSPTQLQQDVIYIGHPADIIQTVKVSEFVPKTRYFSSKFADGISLFLKYTVVFSFGLAFVNIIPCFALDGQHIVTAIIHHYLQGIVPERSKRDLVAFVITALGSFMFFVTIVRVMYSSLQKNHIF